MTRARPSRALRTRIGLGVAVLCLAGPAVQPAAAEDGAPSPAASDLADAAVDAALETVSALTPAEVVPPAPAAAPSPATVTEDPAAPVIPPLDTAVPTEPAQSAPTAPVEAQTAPVEAPTALEATEAPVVSAPEPVSLEPAPAPAPAAEATQVQPINLNVSIRFDSPGDNGAVEQLNAAIVAVVGTQPTAGTEQYQPAAPQYQAPPATGQATAAPPAATPASPAPAPAEPGWTWTWTCGGSTTDVLGAGGTAALLPANWSWNWNWNCGDGQAAPANNDSESDGQYHAGVMQYQPVNLNVSIRIGSPGNDGPVTQTNVSVVVVTPPVVVPPVVISPLPIPLPNLPPSSPGGSASSPHSVPAPAAAADSGLLVELAGIALVVSTELPDSLEWIFRGSAGPFGVDQGTAASDEQDSVAARPPFAPKTGPPAAGGPQRGPLSVSSSALALRAVAVVHAQASVRPDRPAGAKPKRNTSRRPAPPMRAPVLASGFAGATPGGADGGGWPLLALLLVPFSLALVDSSRRMARDAALPAALELFSRRGRPG